MPKRSRKPRQEDENVTAADIVRIATEDAENARVTPTAKKNRAAVALGRKGGLKGGRVRAERLTAEQRKEIAQRAARARWRKDDK
jgi:hypothetical protein